MRRVKGRDTGPERRVRKLIWSLGGRYRLNRADLPGKPDIVLASHRLVVFVHGCFWHGHDCARGARVPKANRDYWLGKVGRNRVRDKAAKAALQAAGWRVETIWECELKDEAALKARARGWMSPCTAPCVPDLLTEPALSSVKSRRPRHARRRPSPKRGCQPDP
jgi:DNA mismatch endonuclease (patch repair protein)